MCNLPPRTKNLRGGHVTTFLEKQRHFGISEKCEFGDYCQFRRASSVLLCNIITILYVEYTISYAYYIHIISYYMLIMQYDVLLYTNSYMLYVYNLLSLNIIQPCGILHASYLIIYKLNQIRP